MNVSKSVKVLLKSRFPWAVAAYKYARQILIGPSLATVFSAIYHTNAWQDPESVSERGSTLVRTRVIASQLPTLLQELNTEILLDAACGDFNWMKTTDLGAARYIGVDVVPDLIRRNRRLYESSTRFPCSRYHQRSASSCGCCFVSRLIHLSFKRIDASILNFKRSGATYLLCTNHITVVENIDCPDGSWRSLNLQLPPFNFPPPLKQIVEDEELGKYLALWRLEDL